MKFQRTIKVIAIVLCVGFGTMNEVNAQEVPQQALAKELGEMRDTDQKLRRKWAKLAKKGDRETAKFKKLTNTVIALDSTNTERMKEIVAQYGWPTIDMVGKRASNSAWLLVQHADRDPLFQAHCLPLLKEASDTGFADPVNYAYLYDRVQVAKGQKQLYATQSSTNNGIKKGSYYPIEEEAEVQNRRAVMGFDLHIETYAKSMGFEYKVLNEAEAQQKSDAFAADYEKNIDLGKKAKVAGDHELAVTHYELALKNFGSIQAEDYVVLARMLSISKHTDAKYAASYLMKAALNGWSDWDEVMSSPDFEFAKAESPRNWDRLLRMISELRKKE